MSAPPERANEQLDKRDLTAAELKRFAKTLWPAKAVSNREELRDLLDSNFYSYDNDNDGENGMDTDEQWKNFSAFTRKIGGFAWLNALHAFSDEEGLLDTALTYVVNREPDEWRFVRFLLQMGADPNVRNSRGETPLFLFLNGGMMRRLRTFDLLLESGANDRAVYAGMTMIQFAYLTKSNDQVGEMVWDTFKNKHGCTGEDMEESTSD